MQDNLNHLAQISELASAVYALNEKVKKLENESFHKDNKIMVLESSIDGLKIAISK